MLTSPNKITVKAAGKIIAALLLIALLLLAGFQAMRGSGSWVVAFSTETDHGIVVIHLDSKPARQAKVVFTQSGAFPAAQVILKNSAQSLPCGKIVFFDNTTRPGRVIIEINGHRLDIMQRALFVNGTEHAWSSTAIIEP